ncbi:hypothetical protein [Streptomyces sp. NRRL F-2580]|uniref:hypothetical protein n=1 Tax=Streptomyces sp. NRRL F-2580 TaxID=1463841 RepID=UPI0004C91064|nr:hypothetical protein [Streptomyces sp. NRRL F-2580]
MAENAILAFAGGLVLWVAWLALSIVWTVGGVLLAVFQDDYGVPCKDAFAYLPALIPDGATNLRCRSHGVDETFQVTFRMPQADLDAWVAESFPDRKPPDENPFLLGPCKADLCVGVMRDRLDRSNEGATDIALTARHADDGTTLVSFDAS